jgi:hypothetical protein
MSLTQILDLPDVAAEFSKYVRVPSQSSCSPELIAPPIGHSSYALVGTAFDYCMRFCIAASNSGLVVDQSWIAEIALELIEEEKDSLPEGLSFEQVVKGVARARQLYGEFLASRIFTRPLARAALFLAALDRAYRTGPETVEVRYLRGPLQAETDDCLRLVRIINREMIVAKERASLNPSFGEASSLVGGADADLVIDDTLVDIKTTKYFQITPAMVHQLVGYRILLAACEPHGSTAQGAPRITHAAIYFSRHAKLERLRYIDLIDRQDFLRLSEWFINYVSDSKTEINLLVERVRNAEVY